MQGFPHVYRAGAGAGPEGAVRVSSPGLAPIETNSPPQFGGPEGCWSPETLLTSSVADCFVLTFRAIAQASRLEWTALECEVDGELDRIDRVARFTRFHVRATLRLPGGSAEDKARRLLQKAEENCLITNSMSAEVSLEARIEVDSGAHTA